MVRWILLAAGLAVAVAGFVLLDTGGISEEAAALIAEGDAARAEADARQAEAEEIAERLDQLLAAAGASGQGAGQGPGQGAGQGADPSISRSLIPQANAVEIKALRDQLESVLAEKLRLETEATDLWLKAASIDAEAQDAIIQRMRGTRPKS